MQEEIKRSTRDGSSSKDDEENLALASKARKGKEKDSHSKSNFLMEGRRLTNLK